MRPTSTPSRTAIHISTSAWSKKGFFLAEKASMRSLTSGETQAGSAAFSRIGTRMNRSSSALVRTGTMLRGPAAIIPPVSGAR